MEPAERVVIACLLLEQGAPYDAVGEFLDTLEAGIADGEGDSIDMHAALIERARRQPPSSSPAGLIVRLMLAKLDHDRVCQRFGMAQKGFEKVLNAIEANPSGGLGARILAARIIAAVNETCGRGGSFAFPGGKVRSRSMECAANE